MKKLISLILCLFLMGSMSFAADYTMSGSISDTAWATTETSVDTLTGLTLAGSSEVELHVAKYPFTAGNKQAGYTVALTSTSYAMTHSSLADNVPFTLTIAEASGTDVFDTPASCGTGNDLSSNTNCAFTAKAVFSGSPQVDVKLKYTQSNSLRSGSYSGSITLAGTAN